MEIFFGTAFLFFFPFFLGIVIGLIAAFAASGLSSLADKEKTND